MVVNSQTKVTLDMIGVHAFVRKLSVALRLKGQFFNVCFVDDIRIQRLNAEFRGKPRPTDVLSFPWAQLGSASLQTADEPGPLTRRFALPSPQGRRSCSTSSCYPLPGGEGSGKRGSQGQAPGIRASSGLGREGRWGDEFADFLGDIVISAETARRNAALAGRFTLHEIHCLMLHGLLHLLGYDHETDHGEMTRLELSLRVRLGIDGLQDKSKMKKQKAKSKKKSA